MGRMESYDCVRPMDLVKHVHSEVWLDPCRQSDPEVVLLGHRCEPLTTRLAVSSHCVVAYVEAGVRMRRRFAGKEIAAEVSPGQMGIKDAATVGTWSWERETINGINAYIADSLVQCVGDEIYGPAADYRLRDSICIVDDAVLGIVHELAREAASDEPGSGLMIRSLGRQLAVRLIRHHAEITWPEVGKSRGFGIVQRQRIVRYIATHLTGCLSVAELARQESVSEDRYSRLFRDSFDCAPHRYITQVRLDRAWELLGEGQLSLSEIAFATGFADQSHLTRCFKRRFGVPPGQWQRDASNGKRAAAPHRVPDLVGVESQN